MSGSAVEVKGLTAYLEGSSGLRRVLDRVDLTVPTGRTFALLGESGSGKTCLIHFLLGLHAGRPGLVAGEASILGESVLARLSECVVFQERPEVVIRKNVARWRRLQGRAVAGLLGTRVTLVPQDPITALSPFHSVGRMIEEAVRRGRAGASRAALQEEALVWLERVRMYGVKDVARRYVHQLSGGMAQRVALALALAPRPGVLVADEPTTGLDATLRVRSLELLATAVEEENATLLLITHDVEAARLLAKRVAILCMGQVVEEGPAEVVLTPGASPKHPYTRYLLEAESRLGSGDGQEDRADLAWEPGAAGGGQPAGCAYRSRCHRARGRCMTETPALRCLSAGGVAHRVACLDEEA